MIKKVLTIVFILLIMCRLTVFAGDIPESLMYGEQEALFIGELVSINEQECTIAPLTIMMGSITEDKISVSRINNYYGTNDIPSVGDFVVVVLLSENEIDDLWIFKATTSDYRTLELVSERYNIVERYQEYINNGAYFDAQEKLDTKIDNTVKETNIKNISNDIGEKDDNLTNIKSDRLDFSIIIGIVFLFIMVLTVYLFQKKKIRNSR